MFQRAALWQKLQADYLTTTPGGGGDLLIPTADALATQKLNFGAVEETAKVGTGGGGIIRGLM